MRTKEQRRICRDGHKGKFVKLNGVLWKCEACGANVGEEIVKKIKGR